MNKFIYIALGFSIGIVFVSGFVTNYEFYHDDIGKTFKLRDADEKNFYSLCTAKVLYRERARLLSRIPVSELRRMLVVR
jgi:hypothetical protein